MGWASGWGVDFVGVRRERFATAVLTGTLCGERDTGERCL